MHQFDDVISNIKNKVDVRQNLIALKSELSESKEVVTAELVDAVRACLDDEDAKARKNAATILGMIAADESADVLWASYNKEDTLFVKEAYLLAIANASKMSAELFAGLKKELTSLTAITPEENEKKHITAQIKALDKLMSKFSPREKRQFKGWDNRWDVVLEYPGWSKIPENGLKVMLNEVKKADRLCQVKKHPWGIVVRTNELKAVANVRAYSNLTFSIKMPEGEYTEETKDDYSLFAKDLVESNLISLVEKMYGLTSSDTIYFRLKMYSAKTGSDKSNTTRQISDAIEQFSNRRLVCDTEKYDIEIVFREGAKGCSLPSIRCVGLEDSRFDYRKNAIATSTHPSLVSLVLAMCEEYMDDNATILDAFCGVGTYIIERDKFAPSLDRYALDIFGEAITIAKVNANNAHMHANFITRDIKDFTSKHPFDEIYADFPVANTKERQAEISSIYDVFFTKAEKLLSETGHIFAISKERGFIMKNLRLHTGLKLVRECKVCGDEYSLYIISNSTPKRQV